MSSRGGGRSRRERTLDPQERELWTLVTRSIRRLGPAMEPAPPEPETEPPEPEAPKPAKMGAPAKTPIPSRLASPHVTPLAPLEPKLRRRLARGAAVDARLDLHGLTQDAAYGRLMVFLRGSQASGHSLVLVITGKGDGGGVLAGEGGRGVLRRQVPQWLAAPELRSVILGFETAGRGHGGEGALYVRLRRSKGHLR